MVPPEGFEPPTRDVEDRCAVQLCHGGEKKWSTQRDSNPRPADSNSAALPAELWILLMVHPEGFEPPTHGFVVHCSVQLSYECPVIYYMEGKEKTASPPGLADGKIIIWGRE